MDIPLISMEQLPPFPIFVAIGVYYLTGIY